VPGVTFERHWRFSASDIGRSVALSDAGYFVGGGTATGSASGAIVLSVSSAGDTVWTRPLSGLDEGGGHLCRLTDGGLAVAGTQDSLVLVRKLTARGDSVWVQQSSVRGVVNAVAPTADAGCLVTGRIPVPGDDFGLIRFDSNGGEAWSRRYHDGSVYWTMAFGVRPTADGGCIISGTGWDYANSYARLVRVGSGGDTVWTRLYRGPLDGSLSDAIECAGGFAAAGSERDTLTYRTALFVMRTDSTGTPLRSASLSVSRTVATASAIDATIDGGFIVAGQLDWGDSTRIWLVRFSAELDTLWTRTFGGPVNEVAADVRQAADRGFVVCGTSDSAGGSILLIKTDSLGMLGVSEAPAVRHPGPVFVVTPNPARSVAHLTWTAPLDAPGRLVLADATGRVLRDTEVRTCLSTDVDLSGLPSGVYLIRLTSDGLESSHKLVIGGRR
jgi:hypothetical protein